jgi:hypothetical protein
MKFKVIVTTVKSGESKEFSGLRHQEDVTEMLVSEPNRLKVHETQVVCDKYGGITAFVTTVVQRG